MGPDPSYDDLWIFLSYASLSTLCSEGRSAPHYSFGDAPETIPPHLHHTLGVIATLVVRDHLQTTDDLEFIGMVECGENLIFDALCSNSGLDPSSQ